MCCSCTILVAYSEVVGCEQRVRVRRGQWTVATSGAFFDDRIVEYESYDVALRYTEAVEYCHSAWC